MVDVIYKKCNKCWIKKPATNEFFSKRSDVKSWLNWICKECKSKQWHIRYENNKERKLEKNKKWKEENIERYKEKQHERYLKNKEHMLQQWRIWYENNKEHYRLKKKEYYKKNKEIIEKRQKELEYWKYKWIHMRTRRFCNKHWIVRNTCSLCWSHDNIQMHHPSYDCWNKVVIVCTKCHMNIHAWNIQCPEPIDLLKLI